MYYVDSQRTVTRRESSLIVPKRYYAESDIEGLSTARAQSTARLISESTTSLVAMRPKGSVQKELVTIMFESMLDSIVKSWEVIVPTKNEENSPVMDFGKSPSELMFSKSKKQKSAITKPSKTKRSRSKLDFDPLQIDPLQHCWWSSPDERAVIRFRNGNVYEGSISMKCMHGEGRFQWADGTVYLVITERCTGCYAKLKNEGLLARKAKQVHTECKRCEKAFCLECYNTKHA